MPRIETHRPRPRRREAPNSVFADVFSIVLLGLVLLGVVGFVYRALRPGGWIGSTLDSLWEKSPALVWMAGFGCVIAFAMLRGMFPARRERQRNGDLLLYVGASLGLFFLFKLIATGSL